MGEWKVKDTVPQVIKDLENESEIIEVVTLPSGQEVARAIWRDQVFDEPLPKGLGLWPEDEIKSIMKGVARSLKVKIGKAKWEAMAVMAGEAMPKLPPREKTDKDWRRLDKAKDKRSLRAAKRGRSVM